MALAIPAFAQQPQFKTPGEYTDYNAFYQEQNPARKAELVEKFLSTHKDSEFRTLAYGTLAGAYENSQNWAKVLEAAGRFEQEIPNAPLQTKGTVYLRALNAAQNADNFQKLVEYGDKILAIDPGNLNAQLVLSSMLPERLPQDEAGKNAALAKAFDLGMKARNQVEVMFKQPKPADFTQEVWDQQKRLLEGQVHANLGIVHLHKLEYDQSVLMYEHVVQLNPKDGLSQYRLGLGYAGQAAAAARKLQDAVTKENEAKAARGDQALVDELVATREAIQQDTVQKQDKAIDSFAKSVAIGGGAATPAREQLERLYRVKNNDSLDGMDALINSKKSALGI
jgi:tetratricopeptide (TPR) repeat protein